MLSIPSQEHRATSGPDRCRQGDIPARGRGAVLLLPHTCGQPSRSSSSRLHSCLNLNNMCFPERRFKTRRVKPRTFYSGRVGGERKNRGKGAAGSDQVAKRTSFPRLLVKTHVVVRLLALVSTCFSNCWCARFHVELGARPPKFASNSWPRVVLVLLCQLHLVGVRVGIA